MTSALLQGDIHSKHFECEVHPAEMYSSIVPRKSPKLPKPQTMHNWQLNWKTSTHSLARYEMRCGNALALTVGSKYIGTPQIRIEKNNMLLWHAVNQGDFSINCDNENNWRENQLQINCARESKRTSTNERSQIDFTSSSLKVNDFYFREMFKYTCWQKVLF